MKRFLILVFGCAMMLPLSAQTVEFKNNGLWYSGYVYNGVATAQVIASPEGEKYKGDIVIPEQVVNDTIIYTVTTINTGAFSGTTELTSLSLPSTVTRIYGLSGTSTDVTNCTFHLSGVQSFYISPENTAYTSVDGVLFSKDLSTVVLFPPGRVGEYAIPNGVETIGEGAFISSRLTNIAFPSSLKVLKEYSFAECVNLQKAELPEKVTRIGNWCFLNCESLTSFHIPSSWSGRTMLNPFAGCHKLRAFTGQTSAYCGSLGNPNKPMYYTKDGVLYNGFEFFGDYRGNVIAAWPEGKEGPIDLSNVSAIENSAFACNNTIREIEVPKSISCVYHSAFLNCKSLKRIKLEPRGWPSWSVGSNVCNGCTELEEAEINVTDIRDGLFNKCTSLKKVTLGPRSKFIYDSFYDCTSLETIVIKSPKLPAFKWAGYDPFTRVDRSKVTIYWPYQGEISSEWEGFNFVHSWPQAVVQRNQVVSFSDDSMVDENGNAIDLSNVNIDNVVVTLDSNQGDSYDVENGCLVVKSIMNDVDVDELVATNPELGSVEFVGKYDGISFLAPAGKGTINIDCAAGGASTIHVKIGQNATKSFTPGERNTLRVSFNCDETTPVYVYHGQSAAQDAMRAKVVADDAVLKLYSVEVVPALNMGDTDGNGVVNGSDVTALYNLLLNGVQSTGDTDVDGNGVVNGSDVTALYNLLLVR